MSCSGVASGRALGGVPSPSRRPGILSAFHLTPDPARATSTGRTSPAMPRRLLSPTPFRSWLGPRAASGPGGGVNRRGHRRRGRLYGAMLAVSAVPALLVGSGSAAGGHGRSGCRKGPGEPVALRGQPGRRDHYVPHGFWLAGVGRASSTPSAPTPWAITAPCACAYSCGPGTATRRLRANWWRPAGHGHRARVRRRTPSPPPPGAFRSTRWPPTATRQRRPCSPCRR